MRQRAAGQAGAGAATDHRHAPLATHAQGLQHLRHRRRQRHQQRRLPIRAQTIALINARNRRLSAARVGGRFMENSQTAMRNYTTTVATKNSTPHARCYRIGASCGGLWLSPDCLECIDPYNRLTIIAASVESSKISQTGTPPT